MSEFLPVKMVKLIYYAFLLICLQNITINAILVKESVYSYSAHVITKTHLSGQSVARWTLQSNLNIQHLGYHTTIMKLDQLKTSMYNGPEMDIENSKQKEISEEAQVLQLPVVIRYEDNEESMISHISVLPEDPEWSVNMKRAICSIFQFPSAFLTDTPDEKMSDVLEKNVYGTCKVHYKGTELGSNGFLLKKTILHGSCRNDNKTSEPYVYKSQIGDNLVLNVSTERLYTFTDRNDRHKISRIVSISNITYSAIPHEVAYLETIQHQQLELLSYSENNPRDISNHTIVNKSVIFTNDNRDRLGPGHGIKSSEQLLQEFIETMNQLKGDYSNGSLEHEDGRMNDTVGDLVDLLSAMNHQTLIKIVDEHFDKVTNDIFMNLLPYVQSEQTAKLTKLFATSESLRDSADMRFLGSVASKDLLQNLEHLVYIKTGHRPEAMHIINFASLVAKANENLVLSTEEFMGLINLYIDSLNSEMLVNDYEMQLSFLLGLINLADGLSTESMIALALGNKYSRHIRSLAMLGFKNHLVPHPELVFDNFWPIVKNTSEHLEVRIAAVDLLLFTRLTEQRFYEILNTYTGRSANVHDQHLQNYIYTSLQSLQNVTGFDKPLSNLVKTAFKNFEIPEIPRTWSTGNYRLSYADSSQTFGARYQVRLVADPDRNSVGSLYLSYDGFGLSSSLGSHSMYIKLQGIPEYLLADILRTSRSAEMDVPELLEMIKKNHFHIKPDIEVHVELVVFIDGRVVYAGYLNKESLKSVELNKLYNSFLENLKEYNTVSFPVREKLTLVSDLGTYVEVKSESRNVMLHKIDNQSSETSDFVTYTLAHKSSTTVEESMMFMNPVDNVRFGARKFRLSRLFLDGQVLVDVTNLIVKWQNDNVNINMAADRSISTYVRGKQVLAKYCSTCEDVSESRSSEYHQQDIFPIFLLGFKLNISISGTLGTSEPNYRDQFYGNTYSFPLATAVLMQDFVANHFLYGPSYEPCSISILQKTTPTHTSLVETSFQLSVGINSSILPTLDDQILNVTVVWTELDLSNSSIINHWNATVRIMSQMKTIELFPRLENSVRVFYEGRKGPELCVEYTILYPKRSSNELSQISPESTTSRLELNMGGCKVGDTLVEILTELTTTEEQKEYIQELQAYKICQVESVGLKFRPPTQACNAITEIVHRYPRITFHITNRMQNWKQLTPFAKFLSTAIETFTGFRKLKSNTWRVRTINASIVFDMKRSVVSAKVNRYYDTFNYSMSKYQVNSMIPTDHYNNRQGLLDLGLRRSCSVTSTFVKTFTGKYIRHEKKAHTYTDTFAECFRRPRVGLSFRKLRNGKLGFKLWTDRRKLVIFVANDSLVVTLDGEQLKENYDKPFGDDYLKVYFLGENELLIVGSEVELYFNTEFISVEVWAPYTNLLCGICND